MKKTGLKRYIYDFCVDYDAISNSDITDIHKYLMETNKVVRIKMFRFIKQTFVSTLMFFGSLPSVNPLEDVSMNNQECKIRLENFNVNSNDPTFYPLSIKTNKCSGSCNNINDPYAKLCVPDIVQNLNTKVFSLLSRTNETRHIKWHETCKCKCRLHASVFNNKQRLNEDKCRCECKELIDKDMCDK